MNPISNHPQRPSFCLLRAITLLLASAAAAVAQQAGPSPVKVFVLAGQSNMQGHGEISPAATMGTLGHLVANDSAGDYQFLVDSGGSWASRDDVWIHYERNASTLLRGDLTVGYGASNSTIGPELGFGSVVGDFFDNQVLIVKTAWGGKSLAVDFRPPRSGNPGFYFSEIIRLVRDAVFNLDSHFPDYDGQGYEIVGFGWHQGWNDRVDQASNDEYEANMANFIDDIRRLLRVSDLPFVIATTGMSGWDETHPRALSLMNAQLAVAQYPRFQGSVFTVDTRDFWRATADSPSNEVYHWNRNAATYLDIGLAMGREMTKLLGGTDYEDWAAKFSDAELSNPEADLDGDGLTNDEERLFGLDPASASSLNPIAIPVDPLAGTFSYTRREVSLTGLSYSVWTSPDLEMWTRDSTAIQSPRLPAVDEVETVDVSISPVLLSEPRLYVQLRVTE